jgi:methylenetetrahydrofolate dehydrogenase (NADP+)/methenyltetrahydrofolate cyclohydrolase
MTAQLLDGKTLANTLILQTKLAIEKQVAQGRRAPCLAVVLVGSDPASMVYVNKKRSNCAIAGIRSLAYDLAPSTSEAELLDLIQTLNEDADIDGILVQLPLPKHINEQCIIETIHPKKDVDGFHPYNIGRLAIKIPTLRPCTPKGVMTLLEHYNIDVLGKKVVVVGASNIVGRPQALEMLLSRATVTICHSATQDLAHEVSQADIVVVGVGKPNFVKGEWLKEGAVVVDVGINRLASGKLCGDVEFESALARASYISPVPGGVGPMTVATLLQNTLAAAYDLK